jgi:hypothetical protein
LGLKSGSGASATASKKEEKVEDIKKEEETVPEIYYDSVKKRWVLKGKIYDDEETTHNTDSYMASSLKDHCGDSDRFSNPFDINNDNKNLHQDSIKPIASSKPSILPPKVKVNKPSLPNPTESIQMTQAKSQTVVASPLINKETPTICNNINNAPLISTSSNISTTNKPNVINNPFLAAKKESFTQQSQTVRPPPRINMANRYASMLDHNK